MAPMSAPAGNDRPFLNRRLAAFGTTIFAEMSALAARTGSINLGQGFPDTDGPAEIAEAASRAVLAGLGNQYPPGAGVPELRTAIAAHQQRFYGLSYDPDTEVLVTAGATEAIAAALLALLEPGDEVIALEPFYDSYAACIAMAGAVRVPLTLRAPDFRPDLDALRDAITPRTRLLLLNTPHNPTGTVLTPAELAGIAELAVRHDLLVITDEVYEHLVFEGSHTPLASLPGMRERTVTISSAGKTYSFTGWKVGWITSTPELVTAVRSVKQFLTYVSSGPFQYAVAEALGLPDSYYEGLRADLAAKRDLLSDGLAAAGFQVYRPQGTYFVTTDIAPLGESDGIAFCRALPERCGVVAIPNQVFYDDKSAGATQVRWAFCKKTEVLREAVDRLRRLA
ncbi:pyridoxal phosphate-dependent aminotransferase [Streptomyces goshikiensis]|uniref:Pyridoxal phosphate-dependent aminotransferase n=1 Tax=Streptomyces goshikiensis TaxID=1942 RepID=A0ABZ1RM54_9ACTN|nr:MULTISPECIES: pyridoxal phosphate-dependent aminotransferase [Streptomyces]EDX24378.1 aminotransferase [Streptomyces sp. Mg1]PJN19004.1 aminotransferase [Streptomyces sp. CB02120-2]WBY21231.1 pyridoxal phosphate-dependent aminotransferase [Streptomyces goshikiensis]WSS00026.1 pyridoxal phosphate-dependent aminotransferase [Streptomyces goshikiensis]WSX98946.1 pyridoxal phosphate-dependent aminotransferase [Streptomyces goshikiensis]